MVMSFLYSKSDQFFRASKSVYNFIRAIWKIFRCYTCKFFKGLYNLIKFINAFFSKYGKYSNGQIQEIVTFSAKVGKNGISQQDILDCIENGNAGRGFKPPVPTIDLNGKTRNIYQNQQ